MVIHIHIDANTTPEQEKRVFDLLEKQNAEAAQSEKEFQAARLQQENERTLLFARFGEAALTMLRDSNERAAKADAEYREHVKNNPAQPPHMVLIPVERETPEQRLEREKAELQREREAALGGSPTARYPGENTCTCGANPGVDPALHTVGCPTRTHIAPQPNQASSP